MKSTPQWMPMHRIGKKIYPLGGAMLRATDPSNPKDWLSYDDALKHVKTGNNNANTIGFYLTPEDPYFFVDIDNCRINGVWSQLSFDICERFKGAYVEKSNSGNGIHIFGRSSYIPDPNHKCVNPDVVGCSQIELYNVKRCANMTGILGTGDTECDCSEQLEWLCEAYFPPKFVGADADWWTDKPREDWDGPTDDYILIQKAASTVSVTSLFTQKASFDDLFNADPEELAKAFPPEKSGLWNGNRVDMALASHLAFWTGCDCERIKRIMFMSELVRDKWDREKYIKDTIRAACAGCENVYSSIPKSNNPSQEFVSHEAESVQPKAEEKSSRLQVQITPGFKYLDYTAQVKHFADCTYVLGTHQVVIPDGSIVSPERFRAVFGGHIFGLDSEGDKTTKNAWEAFSESQVVKYPWAHFVAFRPDLPPGVIFEDGGLRRINIYRPIAIRRIPGDVTPFLAHLEKLLPNKSDRDILIAYLAACVQYQGQKFQWAPILQGVMGNGKTIIIDFMEHAIAKRYCYRPKAKQVGSRFNANMIGKIFVGIEEFYAPGAGNELIEDMKVMITNYEQEIEPKGKDKYMMRICANYLLMSNHRDVIRLTRNSRRWAMFYTAQQSVDDLKRDGMDDTYYPNLWNWARREGFAYVAHFLKNYEIPAHLNPALECGGTCDRAPKTTTTDEAIFESRGRVEQEIVDSAESEKTGFRGGWVSSYTLRMLLKELRRDLSPVKQRQIMKDLGYIPHPAFHKGRAPHNSPVDGATRPTIYILAGSPYIKLGRIEAMNKYVACQQGVE